MNRPTGVHQVSGLLLLSLALFGCAASPAMRAAERDDWARVRSEVLQARAASKLSRGQARDLAEVVLARAVATADGKTGADLVHGLAPCARAARAALEQRAAGTDAVAAEATLVLFESHLRDDAEALVARYAAHPSPEWRRVGARALGPGATALRKKLILDPDERVRAAALQSARDARAGVELEALLEAARLDPAPLNQSLAVRAVGSLGGQGATLGLLDICSGASPELRISIVDAWAYPSTYTAGGARELRNVVSQERGLTAISAARSLRDEEGRGISQSVLERTLRDGSDEEKIVVLELGLDDTPASKAALERAAADPNELVRVLAMTRLLERGGRSPDRLAALRTLAQGKSRAALRARTALVKTEDRSLLALLRRDLASPAESTRLEAALALWELKDEAWAAELLGDPVTRVRVQFACSISAERLKS